MTSKESIHCPTHTYLSTPHAETMSTPSQPSQTLCNTSIDQPSAPLCQPVPPPSPLVSSPHGQVSPPLYFANIFPKALPPQRVTSAKDRQNLQSTRNTSPVTTISKPPVMKNQPLPLQEPKVRTQMAYLQTVEFTEKVSTDQTERFPVTSSRGSKYLMVLYDHDSNAILADPLPSRN